MNPSSKAFAICRDKLKEKKHFTTSGIPCADFIELEINALNQQREKIEQHLPGFIKIRTEGYDGK